MLKLIGFFAGFIEVVINLPIYFLELFFSKEEKIKRKLKRTKEKQINEIKPGDYVKIIGIAEPFEKIMTSPLSKKKCIGYQVLVGRQMSDYYEDQYIKEEIIQNFYLTDKNSKILIIPKNAIINLKKENIGNSGLFKDASSNVAEFLKRHKTSATSFGFNKSLDFKEGVLEKGQKITIVGKVSSMTFKNKEKQIVMRNIEKTPLYIQSN